MNVVDSSGWIEYFSRGSHSAFFRAPLHDSQRLLVPTVSVYEVYRWVCRRDGTDAAVQAAGLMSLGQPVDLDPRLAAFAAELGLEHALPMADSIIYATARAAGATLWTQDADFEGLEGVEYRERGGSDAK